MSRFLVKVKKSFAGETWENNYGVWTGIGTPNTNAEFTQPDLDLITAEEVLTATNTDPGSLTYLGDATPPSILAAIIGFERLLHYTPVTIQSVYITDGQRDTTEFATINLGFACLRTFTDIDAEDLAPGNISLMLPQVPHGVNSRQGRKFYRGALSDAEVTFSGFRLLGLVNAGALNAAITGFVSQSNLGAYMAAVGSLGVPEAQLLMVPKFTPFVKGPPPSGGELVGGTAIVSMGGAQARSRQVNRGRKES